MFFQVTNLCLSFYTVCKLEVILHIKLNFALSITEMKHFHCTAVLHASPVFQGANIVDNSFLSLFYFIVCKQK